MPKDAINKKLLLGSAFAGLLVVAPGLSVTASPTGGSTAKFFQTAQFEVGYRIAHAEDNPAGTGDEETGEPEEEKSSQKGSVSTSSSTTSTTTSGEEKDEGEASSGEKKSQEAKCGAGSCG